MADEILQVDTHKIGQKGEELFRKYNEKLEKTHHGKVIAIEVESGDYFIGDSGVEATKKAKEKYPSKIFF
jgi:uncharacterized HAD superfamily protein